MPSTSASNILTVDDLHLVFQTQFYKQSGLRDLFIQTMKNPLGLMKSELERLYILQGLSFKISAGERVGLIGVNGAGKTSLCRCIADIYRPTRGAIKIQGQVRALLDTSIGFYPELTGRENAGLIANLLFPQRDLTNELADAFEFSELGHFLDTPFKYYSNGMQARLCLSVASMLPSDLLILDEVFDGADVFFREKIAKRIENLILKSGAALFVSHTFSQIQRVCNRVLILKDGKIVFDGPVNNIEKEFAKFNPGKG